MLFRLKLLLAIFFLSTALICCNGGKMEEKIFQFESIKDIQASKWEKLAQKKIFFGHQSVGNNIFEGIREVMKENLQIKLNIVETNNSSDFNVGVFAHSGIGKNHDPISKIDAFSSLMKKGIGNISDIAFFKFCFVDVDASTDIQKIFADYKSTMTILVKEYPKTTFIHFTVPLLRKEKTSFKTKIKALLGNKDSFFANENNIVRNDFNQLLRNEYEGKYLVFDLAKIESTHPGGTSESFMANGKTYYSLSPEYTEDGGHLNQKGRKIVAEQLLLFLSNL